MTTEYDSIEYSDEQLSKLTVNSKNIEELLKAMAYCLHEIDELKKLGHSQILNRRRKYFEYMAGRIKQRMDKINKDQMRKATLKKLRRHETKAKQDTMLKSLLTALVTAKGNQTNHPTPEPISELRAKNALVDGKFVTGDPVADAAMNAIMAKKLAGQEFKQISEDAKKAPAFSVQDLFVRNEDGGCDL